MPAKHFSAGKLGVDQILPEVQAVMGLIFTYGESKYGRDNYLDGGQPISEWMGSAQRHYIYFMLGEDDDPESGLPHLGHMLWNIHTAFAYTIRNLGLDDRKKVDPAFIAEVRKQLEVLIPARVAAYKARTSPTMTDLMVSPESIDEFLASEPEDDAETRRREFEARAQAQGGWEAWPLDSDDAGRAEEEDDGS